MPRHRIVVDTNVFFAALRSSKGASHRLFQLIESGKFQLNVSVPLILEYESIAKRHREDINLTGEEIDDIIDYICSQSNEWKIYYLWRPYLKDSKDDMVLELAASAGCSYIVTFNSKDFGDIDSFGIRAIAPKEFLQLIGGI
uniref:Putative toxin-antitoxin system toxin component, PIN family n=1 Tax=Candidatus Kentrum sp. FM TaxID=2126340 RepID=A0A450W6H2_9GAMM|nr:MAG: putative toxin-antitoxin system toxin component, PIN family [Candidatus Kentron sp. FM]VFJ56723.1 MAG: putative toxin-antitoxin system toxin component, PIN family [Candidatus Kentron sp. FM]VFK12609.1 MAG: putative toxin-antitoxin system toxin component, PIN family [Candidatus Kentron sp. FM]